MKILILYRTKGDEVGRFIPKLKTNLEKEGHVVEVYSRKEDLFMPTLSSSMEGLKSFVKEKNIKENYDIIYTQDWSLAFPLVFPLKIFSKKHYCLFHNIEPKTAKSKILQKITANLLGKHLLVKIKALKDKYPQAKYSPDGMDIIKI